MTIFVDNLRKITSPVVVQIDSVSHPGRKCYLVWNGKYWFRHTDIAQSFENRAAAILTVERLRCQLIKNPTEENLCFVGRLRKAQFVLVENVHENIYVREEQSN